MARSASFLLIFFMFLPMLACTQNSAINADVTAPKEDGGKTYEAVFSAFKGYIKAFQEKDIDGVMSVFSEDPNTVMMGTGPDEIWVGKEDIRMAHEAFLADFEKTSTEQTLVSVAANGKVAWMTGYIEETKQNTDTTDTAHINLSLVFEQEGDTWYITVMHFSNLTGPK
jgi:uncharacterized protein (TIGR02246 family)